MTMLEPQPAGIPAPRPSVRAMPYWEGCRAGELRYQRCASCGYIGPRPFTVCGRCGSNDVSWERSLGKGRLYSWTIVWRPQHPSFVVPYSPAVIEMDEGYWMMSAMVGCTTDDLVAGMRVTVEFHEVSDEITLPYFRPASEH
ncbi:MAG TPA: OB-fold domain-containing protein [Acidimicrobiales bacterium]|nr:OB-fold domain-containing protein [Acidimicrobiales bacterium]